MSDFETNEIRTLVPASDAPKFDLRVFDASGTLRPTGVIEESRATGASIRDITEMRASLQASGAFETLGRIIYNEPRSLADGEVFTPSSACTVSAPASAVVICHSHWVGDSFWMNLHAGSTLDAALLDAIEDGSFDRSAERAQARRCIIAGGAFEHGVGHVFALPVAAVDDAEAYRAHAAALFMAGVKDMRVWQETYAMGLPVEYALAMTGGAA